MDAVSPENCQLGGGRIEKVRKVKKSPAQPRPVRLGSVLIHTATHTGTHKLQSIFSLCTSLGESTKSCPLYRMMAAVMVLAAPQNIT